MGFNYEDPTSRWKRGWPLSAKASDGLGPRLEMKHRFFAEFFPLLFTCVNDASYTAVRPQRVRRRSRSIRAHDHTRLSGPLDCCIGQGTEQRRWSHSRCLRVILIHFLFVDPKFLRGGLQRWVKLHKRMFDGGVVFVALPACCFGIRFR